MPYFMLYDVIMTLIVATICVVYMLLPSFMLQTSQHMFIYIKDDAMETGNGDALLGWHAMGWVLRWQPSTERDGVGS